MEASHRFRDEWFVRIAGRLAGVTPEVIEQLRNNEKPILSCALLETRRATRADIYEAVRAACRVACVEPTPRSIDRAAVALVNEKVCRRHTLVPVGVRGESLEVAMLNPTDLGALGDVEAISGRRVIGLYCLPDRIEELLGEIFAQEHIVQSLLARLQTREAVELLEGGGTDESATTDSMTAPVIQLVNFIIAKAVRMRASDIHIEHEEASSSVRYRIDGLLRSITTLPGALARGPLVSRIKIIANLDVAERRHPQDGRAKLRVGGADIGLRVSTLPTSSGEKVVIRILDKRSAEVPFEKLGIRPDLADRIKQLTGSAQGTILVTGPTGSGKTTTLYSILNRLRSPDTNIVTIEDPIEYKLEGINQVQINERQGLTFPSALRSVLRQDPDVILVGEVRDQETADIAFQAALTGHLVLTTLHTNDAVSSVSRLQDMGVERFKIAPGLLAVTAQRLVRRLCPDCRAEVPAKEARKEPLEALRAAGLPPRLWRSSGCEKCDFAGYRGRLSIVELLEATPEVRERIAAGEPVASIRQMALVSGALKPLRDDALWHLANGDTTIDEIAPHVDLGSPAVRPSGETAPPRVLVVDDDPVTRRLLASVIAKEGMEVDQAEDGLLALERVAAVVPDLVLLDLNMPRLDGYGVVRRMREDIGVVDVPIIVLTAATDEESQVECLKLGADDFVAKPASPPVVLARIRAVLRRRSR